MLKEAGPELRKDFDVAIAAVQEDAEVFQYLELEHRSDRRIALAAIKSHHPRASSSEYGDALQYVGAELMADRGFLLEALRAVGNCFRFLPMELKDDRELALAAVHQDGMALSLLTPELRDFEISVVAVRQNSNALQHVNSQLRDPVTKATGGSAVPGNVPIQNGRIGFKYASRQKKDEKLLKHFKILGLKETATPEEIRRRYRELALQTHPDKQRDNHEDAGNQFALISSAYQAIKEEVLGG